MNTIGVCIFNTVSRASCTPSVHILSARSVLLSAASAIAKHASREAEREEELYLSDLSRLIQISLSGAISVFERDRIDCGVWIARMCPIALS